MNLIIHNFKLKELETKIVDFNKKFEKRKLPLISYTTSNPYYENKCVLVNVEITIPINEFKLIEGYKFLGFIQSLNGQLFYYGVEGLSKTFKEGDNFRCDHCGIDRFRNNGYVFEKEEKRILIGSSCVNKYFPVDIESELAPFAKIINEAIEFFGDDEFNFSCSKISQFDLQRFESVVLISGYVLDKTGIYVKGEDNSTKNIVEHLFEVVWKKDYEKSESDKIEIEKIDEWKNKNIEYIKSAIEFFILYQANNDFEINMKSTFLAQKWNSFGLIAYGCFIYGQSTNRYVNLKQIASSRKSEFQGEIGKKIEAKVKLICVYPNTYYSEKAGMTIEQFIMKFQDENENLFVWRTGARENSINSNYKLIGTVKEHKEYKNQKETILTRCKMETL